MAIVLKSIEIENFKSYTEKQCIHFSDLSVLLGANSSGKSTALQALLIMKQTIECNSPDEELLLSGKYVALGDFDDVISDPAKDYFSLAAVLEEAEKSENEVENDEFRITWRFERADDGISAVLTRLDIIYENLTLSFKRVGNIHHMYINEERSPFSAVVNNLMMAEYCIHYDIEFNNKLAELLNELSKVLLTKKITTVQTDQPVSLNEIENFYFKLMDRIQTNADERYSVSSEHGEMAKRLGDLLDRFGELELPRFEAISRILPKELRLKMLELALSGLDDMQRVDNIISKYEAYLLEYLNNEHNVADFEGIFELGSNPFRLFDRDGGKKDNLTQLKFALDFYKSFLRNILSRVFFVGPIRETPKGLYNIGFETIPKYVGPTGSYFASVLLHENKKEREYILPDRIERCTLSDALAAWMIHLNVASAVDVDKRNSFGFSVSVENMEQVRSDIMNVGIGTSQVLPVLISVLLSEPNEILVFEQPELHLHPYSQSRLADMFTEFCKHGRKIILETHSEYFLLRLRYHIVKEQYSQDATAVNFFQNKGGTKVTFANVSGFGNIDYPEDFRDETQELLNSILEASFERKGLS
ncbi:AAA family ATPase [Blautia sp. HCP3S3_C12]|uniref:AAA family ATPase n=1 Tax=unclassified Blautia TaxID=2648079 RepID=UPI003F8AEC90